MDIHYSDIKSKVRWHLSNIGKRIYSKDGKNMFSNITVSSVEETLFDQYIEEAAQNVEAIARQMVTQFNLIPKTQHTEAMITITLVNTRASEDFDTRAKELITTYITMYTLQEYLSMSHPELAAKYQKTSTDALQSIMMYVYHKEPPAQASTNPLSITTTVTNS